MMVLLASVPISDSGLPMVTLSAYVPGETRTVSFAAAAEIAAPIVALHPCEAAALHTTSRLPQAGSILQSKSAASHHGRGASCFVSSESLFQLLCPAPDIPGSVVLDSIHGLSEIRSFPPPNPAPGCAEQVAVGASLESDVRAALGLNG